MNYFGIFAGAATLLIIGMGFPLVIHTERVLGYLWWPYMMTAGIALIAVSVWIVSPWIAVPVAVTGTTLAWGSTELMAQAERVQRGWFANNPNKVRPPFESVIKKWKVPRL